MTSNVPDTGKWRLITIEIDNSLPRRLVDKANLYVSVCQFALTARRAGPTPPSQEDNFQ
jgi:hypothetical protein